MKLLVIRTSSKLSGAETYNINLFVELAKHFAVDTTFLTNLPELANKLTQTRIHSVYCEWLPEEVGTKRQLLRTILYAPVFVLQYVQTTNNMENGKSFDVLCLQSRTEMIFLTALLKLLGYKVIWIQHGPFFVSRAAGIVKSLFVWASTYVDKIIAVSEDTRKDLIGGGIKENRIEVVYIGIDIKKFTQRNKKTDEFVVGFLGTLTNEKGTDDFLECAKRAVRCYYVRGRDANSNLQFLVIGGGSEKILMQERVRDLGLTKNFYFTGFTRDVKKYLRTIDILVLPTHHHEGVSMAILEAQAMGIPVLATDIGGTREIITHGYNGFLYKLGDVEGMARDIRMLNKNRKLLKVMGTHARHRIVEKFNIEKQAKEFSAFFKSI